MASLPCTYALGKALEKATLPLGTDNLMVMLLQSTGLPSDTTLRNCQTVAAMITAGAVEANFTGYTAGGKVLSAVDISIVYNTTTFTGTLSIPAAQVWNPAGGAVNNAAIAKSVLAYRPTSGAAYSAWLPLGIFDASGGATGGTFTHTVGTLVDDA